MSRNRLLWLALAVMLAVVVAFQVTATGSYSHALSIGSQAGGPLSGDLKPPKP